MLDFHQLPLHLTEGFQDLSSISQTLLWYPKKTYKLFKDRHLRRMANHFSALKRVRQTEKRTEFNRRSKTRLRHQIRAMRQLITEKN